MKQYKIYTLPIAAICLMNALIFLNSCNKTDNITDGMDILGENTQYLLQPPTISVEPFGGSTPATRATVAMKEEQQAFNIGEELGNIIALGNGEAEDAPQTRALANGTYYRIVVYKLSEWNAGTLKIWEQRLCKTGQTAYFADSGDSTEPIYLDYGDYRIFCYSFNKTTTDKLTKLADGAANVPLSDGDDFLSSDIISKNIVGTQLGTNVALGTVTLKHRCCRLIGMLTAVDFATIGIAASPTPSLSVTSTFTTAGNWSIKNANFSETATSNVAKTIPLAKSGNDYMGTLMLLPLSGKLLSTNYTFKPNGATLNVTASNKSISASVTFTSGGDYSFTIKALAAYVLTTTNPVQIGSYKWAYANLNNNKKMETYPWVSGKLNGSDNDYWRWNVLNIDTSSSNGSSVSTWSAGNDPCRAGLGGSWKVPPKTYFDNLVGYKLVSKRVYVNGVTATTNGYGWVSSGTIKGSVFVDTTKNTCLFLPAAGSRFGADFSSPGGFGEYWSATRNDSSTKNAYYFRVGSSFCTVGYYLRSAGCTLRCSQ